MRILVFSNLPPYVLGGAEIQVSRLVSAWVQSGHDVEIAGHRIPTSSVALGNHQVPTHRIYTYNRAGRLGRALTYLISTIVLLARHRKRFDVIYCRGMGDAAISVTFAKAIRLIGLPLVACPINAKGRGDTNFIQSIPGWRLIVFSLNRHCNAVNIIAPAIINDLEKLNVTAPITALIPNGIPIQPPLIKKRTDRVRHMVFTGRLSHQKGLDLLIAALGELMRLGYSFRLDIVGSGPLKEKLRKQIRELSLDPYIRLLGEIPAGEIRSLLVQYDALVLPSRYEGMSNAALEAMEAGIPVLVTRCGGIDHYINAQKGWVCEPDDPKSLMDALSSLLETPPEVLDDMGLQARIMVEEHFDIGMIARKNIELFGKMVATERKQARFE
ncbi:MAG: glycosyltransferase family 4 protein [Desulfobacteraceae bacterium]|nr:glycosyltransferase family 4 protein [Desulfobacteraceae bacterium]MBC2748991.1 glycosyltransferase family 4 protein [Desulfobacteraceae bacterium]